jgi:hypothetical protein
MHPELGTRDLVVRGTGVIIASSFASAAGAWDRNNIFRHWPPALPVIDGEARWWSYPYHLSSLEAYPYHRHIQCLDFAAT